MGSYLLAYDIGTSGTKASLFAVEGKLVKSNTQPHDITYGNGGCVEQNPENWWQAVVKATKYLTEGIDKSEILGISFSGQMMGCVLVDETGAVLRDSIIWADTRAKEEERTLLENLGEVRGYEILGHRISCSYSIAKLMWVKNHQPEIYEKAYKMLQAKDYIILKMTGEFVSDFSDASGTNGLDIEKLCWSQELFDAAGLDIEKMPRLVNSSDVVGSLQGAVAEELGLAEGTKVVCGGGDGPCAALGAGCIKENQYFLTFGTSSWIAGTTKAPFFDSKRVLFSFAHVIPEYYSPTGTMQAAGSSYSYIRNTFFESQIAEAAEKGVDVYELLNKMIEASPVGAKNLLYLPYLVGERSPRWNPNTTGSFIGMNMEHQKEDYLRATLEGVAMNLELILQAHRQNTNIDELILTGGGAKGDVVAQILADVCNCVIQRPDHVEEATSMAAAVLAGVGVGVYDDFDVIHRFLKFDNETKPIPEHHAIYEKRKVVFDQCYYALEPLYEAISK